MIRFPDKPSKRVSIAHLYRSRFPAFVSEVEWLSKHRNPLKNVQRESEASCWQPLQAQDVIVAHLETFTTLICDFGILSANSKHKVHVLKSSEAAAGELASLAQMQDMCVCLLGFMHQCVVESSETFWILYAWLERRKGASSIDQHTGEAAGCGSLRRGPWSCGYKACLRRKKVHSQTFLVSPPKMHFVSANV